MKKSIIITSAVIAGLGILGASTFAASGSTSFMRKFGGNSTQSGQTFGGHTSGMRGMGGPGIQNLTDTEKTAFEAMSDADKKTFLEKKRTENEAKMEAHDTVIDKLLAGTSLTTEEEILRKEIITERATIKAKRTEMKAQMEKIKAILDKKQAGTTLTTEEQALLESMPHMGGRGMKGGRGMGGMCEMMGGR